MDKNSKNTVLTERYLNEILQTDMGRSRTKSVLTLPAQSNTLYRVGNLSSETFRHILSNNKQYLDKNIQIKSLILIMVNGGLRVSEALSVSWSDITSMGHVFIKGKKGSNDKVLHTGECESYFLKCRINSVDPFFGLNRFFVYRLFKSMGIVFEKKGNKNKAVTHAIRNLVSIDQQKNGFSIESTKTHLGHKNIKSTKHYRNE
jgi:integrase